VSTINSSVFTQLYRTIEDIKSDDPCIGICTINEKGICIGCDRSSSEIVYSKGPPPKTEQKHLT